MLVRCGCGVMQYMGWVIGGDKLHQLAQGGWGILQPPDRGILPTQQSTPI